MQFQNIRESILIVDFGSQVTKLIARRIRDLGVFSEIVTPNQINRINDFDKFKITSKLTFSLKNIFNEFI